MDSVLGEEDRNRQSKQAACCSPCVQSNMAFHHLEQILVIEHNRRPESSARANYGAPGTSRSEGKITTVVKQTLGVKCTQPHHSIFTCCMPSLPGCKYLMKGCPRKPFKYQGWGISVLCKACLSQYCSDGPGLPKYPADSPDMATTGTSTGKFPLNFSTVGKSSKRRDVFETERKYRMPS